MEPRLPLDDRMGQPPNRAAGSNFPWPSLIWGVVALIAFLIFLIALPGVVERVTHAVNAGPERAAVFDATATKFAKTGGVVRPPRPATVEELSRIHTAAYLETLQRIAGRAAMLDPTSTASQSQIFQARALRRSQKR